MRRLQATGRKLTRQKSKFIRNHAPLLKGLQWLPAIQSPDSSEAPPRLPTAYKAPLPTASLLPPLRLKAPGKQAPWSPSSMCALIPSPGLHSCPLLGALPHRPLLPGGPLLSDAAPGNFWLFLSKALTWQLSGVLCIPPWGAQKGNEGLGTGLVTPGAAPGGGPGQNDQETCCLKSHSSDPITHQSIHPTKSRGRKGQCPSDITGASGAASAGGSEWVSVTCHQAS